MAYTVNSRTRVVSASFVLFLFSLLLTEYSDRNPRIAKLGSAVIAQFIAPFQIVNSALHNSVSEVWSNYVAVLNLRQEHDALQHRLTSLEAENLRLRELESENERLRQILELVSGHELKGIAALVIGYDASNWVQQVTINKGHVQGIESGMPVVSGSGVVGQVTAVAPGVSRVLLITDPASGLDALVQSSRARGVVSGAGRERCEMRYVLREEAVSIGDRVITSGMDGVFPKGLQVGIVNNVDSGSFGLFQSIEIEPIVNFAKLEEVFVVTNSKVHNQIMELEPAEKKN